jgi:diguanylate cyclase (GGDEF)-like protein/PAS domain S-box-containing protein
MAQVFASSYSGVMITDVEGRIIEVNPAFTRITGYTLDEVSGKNPHILASGQHDHLFYQDMWDNIRKKGHWQGELWNRRKNGDIYPEWLSINPVRDKAGQLTNYVGMFSDISQRKEAEAQIHQLAFYDSLTQLPNRRLLMAHLPKTFATSTRSGHHGAVMFLDLDHFKTLNDTKGHDIGDLLLIEVAKRLTECVREGDMVARLGGDEFIVVLESLSANDTEAAAQAELVAEKIHHSLNQPFLLKEYTHFTTPSIGIVLFKGSQASLDNLLKHADTAMYQAKTDGRNAIRFYDPAMQATIEARANLEAALRTAIQNDQFRLYLQIQMDSRQRPTGAEVLLRWQHPEQGLVSPLQFIPLAEETGLIVPIGLWVLTTACEQLKKWQNHEAMSHLSLAVNVSAKQFRQADFVTQVKNILGGTGASPSRLKLELTESTVLENMDDTIAKMRELKQIGVSFSMDDFGTGYSSLQYLKCLPLDQIKIDQSFVRDITTDQNDAAIVQAIIAMTRALGLNVIAEGVETEAQREFLAKHGCHDFQGYLFSKPLPLEQFELLALQAKKSAADLG